MMLMMLMNRIMKIFVGGFGEEDEDEMLHDAEQEALRKKAEALPKVQAVWAPEVYPKC